MSKIFNISEAAAIAIHSMVIIARSKVQMNVQQVAAATGYSKNHTAKILQQLAKNRFLHSVRGPRGGFILNKKADQISLMDIYRSIEGDLEESPCKMDCQNCPFDRCIFGGLDSKFNEEFKQYMNDKKLAAV
ncbi:MAG: RrF2 family transcriptional regulator [Bacteroidales bacterium]